MVLNADGFGTPPVKISKYHAFTRAARAFDQGFKLFYEEDVGLMSPAEVLRAAPGARRRGVRVRAMRASRLLLAALAAAQVAYGRVPGAARRRRRRARSSG